MEASFLHYWSCLCVELKCFRDAVFSLLEVIPMERGQKIAHELGMISFILGYVVSNCCVQQKGRTCDAKYDSIETFHENVWMFVIRIIYPKKAQNILASFFDPDHQEGFYNVGRQSNTMVPETHQYIGYVSKQWWTCRKAVVQHQTSRLDGAP